MKLSSTQKLSLADDGVATQGAGGQVLRLVAEDFGLSAQEENVMVLALFEGLEDKEIGARLGISPKTVHEYWSRVLTKTGLATQKRVLAMMVQRLVAGIVR